MGRNTNSLVAAQRDQPSNPLRALKRHYQVVNPDQFDRLERTVAHLDPGAAFDTNQIMRLALILGNILLELGGPEFDFSISRQTPPDPVVGVVSALAGEKFAGSLDQSFQVGEFATEDDRAAMPGTGQAEDEVAVVGRDHRSTGKVEMRRRINPDAFRRDRIDRMTAHDEMFFPVG
jgi:hypothetical protein